MTTHSKTMEDIIGVARRDSKSSKSLIRYSFALTIRCEVTQVAVRYVIFRCVHPDSGHAVNRRLYGIIRGCDRGSGFCDVLADRHLHSRSAVAAYVVRQTQAWTQVLPE